VPDVEVLGDPVDRLPHIVTFSCLYVDGEARRGYWAACAD
jgi:cysteine desulfurase